MMPKRILTLSFHCQLYHRPDSTNLKHVSIQVIQAAAAFEQLEAQVQDAAVIEEGKVLDDIYAPPESSA